MCLLPFLIGATAFVKRTIQEEVCIKSEVMISIWKQYGSKFEWKKMEFPMAENCDFYELSL